MKNIALAVAVVLSLLMWSTGLLAVEQLRGYRLSFPALELRRDEQIQSFNVRVSCGHIDSLVGIPDDWNIEVIRRISGVEELRASAGHGASYIRQMKSFNGVIRLVALDARCFSVESEITAVFDEDRIIKLSRKDLKVSQ